MYSANVTAVVKNFSGSKEKPAVPNKHGVMPFWLEVLNGKAPNRNVMDGTIAEREGVELGKTYLFKIQETEPDPKHGRRFTWTKVKELSFNEILQANALGEAAIFSVEKEAANKDLQDIEKAEKDIKTKN